MEYKTARFGTINVDSRSVIELRGYIFGFEGLSKFTILPHRDGTSPFSWLQSLENPEIVFVICSPKRFIPDYNPEMDLKIKESLAIESTDEISIYNLVRFLDGGRRPIVNLRAPLFYNITKGLALQAILDDKQPLRYDFFARKEIPADAI